MEENLQPDTDPDGITADLRPDVRRDIRQVIDEAAAKGWKTTMVHWLSPADRVASALGNKPDGTPFLVAAKETDLANALRVEFGMPIVSPAD